jgi:hypothetical protein
VFAQVLSCTDMSDGDGVLSDRCGMDVRDSTEHAPDSPWVKNCLHIHPSRAQRMAVTQHGHV